MVASDGESAHVAPAAIGPEVVAALGAKVYRAAVASGAELSFAKRRP